LILNDHFINNFPPNLYLCNKGSILEAPNPPIQGGFFLTCVYYPLKAIMFDRIIIESFGKRSEPL
jgi:hypothetical protein